MRRSLIAVNDRMQQAIATFFLRKGDLDGVYVTDASGLQRFFQDRNFHIVRPPNLKGKGIVLHRTAMKSLWKRN